MSKKKKRKLASLPRMSYVKPGYSRRKISNILRLRKAFLNLFGKPLKTTMD